MNGERRRESDQGIVATAARTAQATSKSFWGWVEHHHIDSLAVLVVTLSLTVKVVGWSMDFAYDVDTKLSGTDKAAIIAAVMTPWGIAQAALFKFYVDLKARAKEGLLT